jgi:hypothetical protein
MSISTHLLMPSYQTSYAVPHLNGLSDQKLAGSLWLSTNNKPSDSGKVFSTRNRKKVRLKFEKLQLIHFIILSLISPLLPSHSVLSGKLHQRSPYFFLPEISMAMVWLAYGIALFISKMFSSTNLDGSTFSKYLTWCSLPVAHGTLYGAYYEAWTFVASLVFSVSAISARENVITGAKCDHGTAVVVWAKVRCRGDVCLSFDLAWTGSSQISNPPVRMVNICPEI